MSAVVCRFKCYEKVEHDVAGQADDGAPLATHTVRFAPIADSLFGPWDPAGQLEMRVVARAAERFTVGEEYFVMISARPLAFGGI